MRARTRLLTLAFFLSAAAGLAQLIQGRDPAGSTVTSNPVIIGSVDADGKAASFKITGTTTDRSGTITAGGTAQTVAAANTDRRYLLLQNLSDTDMWLNFGTAAVADTPSVKIVAGASIVFESGFVPKESVSLIGATTGKKFTAKEGE